jgi:hypothetical protein
MVVKISNYLPTLQIQLGQIQNKRIRHTRRLKIYPTRHTQTHGSSPIAVPQPQRVAQFIDHLSTEVPAVSASK